jgi:FkbM family methyltransferase
MNQMKTIARDARGIAAACGWRVALRWLWCVMLTFSECYKTGNLQPADRRMGNGPFVAVRRGAQAKLGGQQVFSGIREIWVRDVYLKNDYLRIPAGALVIDLGANLGNFTSLALAQHDDVRVISVEPSLALSNALRESLAMNGWVDRAVVQRSFIGVTTKAQASAVEDPDYRDAPYVTEQAFLEKFNIQHVDFLKCDIEGSEFFLMDPASKLLSLTTNLAIEIHSWGGSVPNFISFLRSAGFDIGSVVGDVSGGCIALCRRSATPGA